MLILQAGRRGLPPHLLKNGLNAFAAVSIQHGKVPRKGSSQAAGAFAGTAPERS
jgi:hypothetical protein